MLCVEEINQGTFRRGIVILYLVIIGYHYCRGQVFRDITLCCQAGNAVAEHNEPCNTTTTITFVPPERQVLCVSVVELCCQQHYRNVRCLGGIEAALTGQPCQSNTRNMDQYHKDCCVACKFGMAVRDQGGSSDCSIQTEYEASWHVAFRACCLEHSKNFPSDTHTISSNRSLSSIHDKAPPNATTVTNFDECSAFPVGHLCDHQCIDAPEGYYCQCNSGYRLLDDARTCVPVTDRCGVNNPCSQLCTDTGDAVICNCNPGYELQNDKRTCSDIDECALDEDECDLSVQYCVNTIGSYSCVRRHDGSIANYDQSVTELPLQQTCPEGYEYSLDINGCKDIDECALGLNVCDHATQYCSNTEGSYECLTKQLTSCPPGYKYNDLRATCIDVDECAEGRDACNRDREFCLNLQGTYECQQKSKSSCPAGYKYNAERKMCDDVDECSENLHNCDPNKESCRNIVGAYECDVKCEQGYRFNLAHRTCTDIDECQENLHDCKDSYLCTNTLGTYQCTPKHKAQCPAGYKPSDQDGHCIDVNECEEELHTCDNETEECINDIGLYHCQPKESEISIQKCDPGFKTDPEDANKCIDINECNEKLDDCRQQNAICLNTIGSFRCQVIQCPNGYKMNFTMKVCQDVDECLENSQACKPNEEICINTIGSYHCEKKEIISQTVKNCSTGFRADREDPSKCIDINECKEGLHNCHQEYEACVNSFGAYYCITTHCRQGYRLNMTTAQCFDIDECVQNLHNCTPAKEECVNSLGSFYCKPSEPKIPDCPTGYRYNTTQGKCDDINECELGLKDNTCNQTNEICVNTIGSFRCWLVQCPPGYRVNITAKGCEDVNECEEGLHHCPSTDRCVNYRGGYSCMSQPTVPTCPQGYRFNIQQDSCEDINECLEGLDTCQRDTEKCENTPGSFTCTPRKITCPTGYKLNPQSQECEDVDECAENLHSCLRHVQQCFNTQGGHLCVPTDYRRRHFTTTTSTTTTVPPPTVVPPAGPGSSGPQTTWHTQSSRSFCPTGFAYSEESRRCLDINECQMNTHACLATQRCDNTLGSYACVRLTGCGTGYTLNAHTSLCEDDDECVMNTHNCGVGYVCRNTPGSFRCDRKTCPYGYRLAVDGSCSVVTCDPGFRPDASGNCVDYNECETPNLCRTNQRCVNTVGSYQCQYLLNCGPGYEIDQQGSSCQDVDECTLGTHTCGSGQQCVNRPGNYICQCPLGYMLNAQRQCEDIDECTRYGKVCAHNSECQNTPGSYICNCKEGFKHGENDKVCEDVDECKQYGSGICQQTCINTWGSYQCTCQPGYTQGTDKRTCTDIDECSLYKGRGNLCIGFCVNEPGSYSCHCPSGYKLGADKRICQDIDECSQESVCRGPNEICLNTRGGYKCNQIVCPSNYIRDTTHKNRCKRESTICHHGDQECINQPLSYSHNFLTFVSNLTIPPTGMVNLFTMRGPPFQNIGADFALNMKSVRSPQNVSQATRSHFQLRRISFNQAAVSLVQSIPGPQDIELELSMKLYRGNMFGGVAVAKIFIYVSEYEF